jgi:acyl-CoA synthetase (AMP-forming)/AMP-acid ligase II
VALDATLRPTIGALLERSARDFGDEAYVVTPTARLTFADAEARSARAARWLLARGVGKGTRVGLFFTSDDEWVVWWFAATRIGALAAPMSTLYTPAEIAKVLRLGDIEVLVAPPTVLTIDVALRLEAALPALAEASSDQIQLPAAPYLRRVVFTGPVDRGWATTYEQDDGIVSAELLAAVEAEVYPSDLAVMVHTSGTTADPKGVLLTHGTLVRQTSAWASVVRGLAGTAGVPRMLCAMPFFWIGGILAALGAMHEPVTLLVLPRLEAEAGLDLAERERAQGVLGWPAFTQQLRLHPSFAGRDLSSAPSLHHGPADLAMVNVPDGHPIHRSMTETGGSFAFTEVSILGADGQPVPDEEVGELLIRGTGVMAGYNKRERGEVFDADGWYHTSDRVYRKPGDPRLFYVGRDSELIKSAGSNVSPREVEAVIEEYPEVAQCVVVGVDHEARGEEVCAVIVAAHGSVDVGALASRTKGLLSTYKVPTRWIVVDVADMAVLASGKPNRRRIKARVADGSLR